jgi:hypothetical protein
MNISNIKNQDEKKIDFSELMPRLLNLLTKKEKNIIGRRFSLENIKRETLDRIGQSYSITRERVRQIETVALKKLARISMDPSMQIIHNLAFSILVKHGKVMSEDLLVSQMLKSLQNPKNIDVNAMKLAMRVSSKLIKHEKNQFFKPFWRATDISVGEIKNAITEIKRALKKQGDILTIEELSIPFKSKYSKAFIESVLEIDHNFLRTPEGWGLDNWRFINPRSIKDKILISLREIGKPLHFTDIIEHVLNDFNSQKSVTPQAVHNELIRHNDFILVGRGLYGLAEWGLISGTVCDVIKSVFQENTGALSRQDIIEKVLEKREIRLGTISLNLQKYPFFKRVGRAVYIYEPALETVRRKRGRGSKKED